MHNNYIHTSNVKKVEIIRGPGSALYRSNAFLGVINIITDDKQNRLSIETGSFNREYLSFNYYKPFTLETSASISLDYNKDKGEDYAINGKDPIEHLTLSTKFLHDKTSHNLNYTHEEINDFIHFNSSANNTNWSESSTFKAMLNHGIKVSDKININTMFSYSQYNLDTIGLFREVTTLDTHDMFIGPYIKSTSYDADKRFTNVNEEKRTFNGLEGALTYKLLDSMHLHITHAHIFSKIEPQNYKDISSLTVNYAQAKYNININGIFRKQQENVLANQDDYALVNTHVKYKFSNNLNLSFSIDNLLNESYSTYAPKLTVLNYAVVNRGRTWRIGIETKW